MASSAAAGGLALLVLPDPLQGLQTKPLDFTALFNRPVRWGPLLGSAGRGGRGQRAQVGVRVVRCFALPASGPQHPDRRLPQGYIPAARPLGATRGWGLTHAWPIYGALTPQPPICNLPPRPSSLLVGEAGRGDRAGMGRRAVLSAHRHVVLAFKHDGPARVLGCVAGTPRYSRREEGQQTAIGWPTDRTGGSVLLH